MMGKKPGIVIALGLDKKPKGGDDSKSMPPGMPPPDEEEGAMGPDEDFKAVASEAFDAFKAGDKESFISAMYEAIQCCKE